MHESKIDVRSELGKGSIFYVRFPAPSGEQWLVKQSLS
jgi:signal transduction histidine kinase